MEATHNDKDSPISEENNDNLSHSKEQLEVKTSGFGGKFETNTPKSDRLEIGCSDYNYASASKGAKVLDFNKEVMGLIIYCGKTKITNFGHYSSNLQNFELFGSLVYPREKWVNLGVFKDGNMKHAQRLTLQKPKWVRYLKLNLSSHYGSEFYCTLNSVEIYEVDAVEGMLKDLISVQDSSFGPKESITKQISTALQSYPIVGEDIYESDATDASTKFGLENYNVKHEIFKSNALTSVLERRPQLVDGCLIAVKEIIAKNPQSKYLNVDHDHLAQVFDKVKKGCVNFMGPDVTKEFIQSIELLRVHIIEGKESYIDLENRFSQHKAENDAKLDSLRDMVASLRSFEHAATPTINVDISRVLPVVGFLTLLDAHKGLQMLHILRSVIPYFCGSILSNDNDADCTRGSAKYSTGSSCRGHDQHPETFRISARERLRPRGVTSKETFKILPHRPQPSIHLGGIIQSEISRGQQIPIHQEEDERPLRQIPVRDHLSEDTGTHHPLPARPIVQLTRHYVTKEHMDQRIKELIETQVLGATGDTTTLQGSLIAKEIFDIEISKCFHTPQIQKYK
ncbi:hypothetical protein GIB67_040161, partial [Kingdonia uniflora]